MVRERALTYSPALSCVCGTMMVKSALFSDQFSQACVGKFHSILIVSCLLELFHTLNVIAQFIYSKRINLDTWHSLLNQMQSNTMQCAAMQAWPELLQLSAENRSRESKLQTRCIDAPNGTDCISCGNCVRVTS